MIFGHTINGRWGPRREKLEDAADKMLRLFAAWAEIAPELSGFLLGPQQVPFAKLDRRGMLDLLQAGQRRAEDDGRPLPRSGYGLTAWNGRADPNSVAMHSQIGCDITDLSAANYIDLWFRPPARENEHLLTLPVFKPAVLTLAEIWNTTWCEAAHFERVDVIKPIPGRRSPSYLGGWITYIGPRFASLIKPPASAITEHPPGGGILMIATEEPFDVGNPKHIAVARDINAALAPLNALPWPPDSDVAPETVA